MHGMTQLLYESQRTKKTFFGSSTLCPNRIQEINQAIIDCIVKDCRPFSDFNKPGMLKFLKVVLPNYSPPHRQTITKAIGSKYKKYINKLTNEFKSIPFISITTDMWKSKRNLYFLALTGHFFTKDFSYKSIVFSFKKFVGRHLSKRIYSFVSRELDKLAIKNKIVSTTTDNANDIKAGVRGLGTWISCFCHNLNLVLHSVIKFTKIKK